MKKYSVKKLALAGMFCALCVVGSVFSFPMFGSKCAPVPCCWDPGGVWAWPLWPLCCGTCWAWAV